MAPLNSRALGLTLCLAPGVLLSASAALAQGGDTAGATITRVVARQFPEWKPAGTGQPFRLRTPSGVLGASWSDGASRLNIEILKVDSFEALRKTQQLFETRSMTPPNRPVAYVGDESRLFELSDRVEIGFTSDRDLLHLVLSLHTPGPARALLAPAPPLDVDRAVVLARAMAGAIGATGSVRWAAGLKVDVARQKTPPPEGVPAEARGAGVEPEPNNGTAISFGTVRDPGDHGSLSSWVVGKISSAEVTWTDPAVFADDESAVRFLRSRLGNPDGSRYTFVVWSQGLGRPSLTANARHVNGRTGRILIWRSGSAGALYAYQDGDGKWWFGGWQNVAY